MRWSAYDKTAAACTVCVQRHLRLHCFAHDLIAQRRSAYPSGRASCLLTKLHALNLSMFLSYHCICLLPNDALWYVCPTGVLHDPCKGVACVTLHWQLFEASDRDHCLCDHLPEPNVTAEHARHGHCTCWCVCLLSSKTRWRGKAQKGLKCSTWGAHRCPAASVRKRVSISVEARAVPQGLRGTDRE